ncbi:MAG TPA: thiamine-binding protein, partial [Paludibacteraceae bacterium]|nr:thiamine-binding protein [Paludibacteraceae bacterium]
MDKIVNIALQILPTSATVHPYNLVDKAIEVIAASGLKYRVTPFETVME